MREVPRSIPTGKILSILTSGTYILIGISFIVSGMLFLGISGGIQAKWEVMAGTGFFILWGIALVLYSVRSNWKRLHLLIWGKLYHAQLLKREKSHNDFFGNTYFDCDFQFEYHQKKYLLNLTVPNAQEMDDKGYYLLFFEETNPKNAICLYQFTPKFVKYFRESFDSSIKMIARNQGLG